MTQTQLKIKDMKKNWYDCTVFFFKDQERFSPAVLFQFTQDQKKMA